MNTDKLQIKLFQVDLVRYQVANCYMGRCGLINSAGESKGESALADAVRAAVINKRDGGMGTISGRKAFYRPTAEGVELLNTIQKVYLAQEITVAQRLCFLFLIKLIGGKNDG